MSVVTTGVAGPEVRETRPPGARRRRWVPWARRGAAVAVVAAGIVAAVDRRHDLGRAAHLLGHLRWPWVLIAVGFEAASLVAFARLQRWLLRAGGVRVRLGAMVEITLAGNALAMSLPGGAAWAAAWAYGQLRRRGVQRVLAGWVVLVAGALESFALFVLLVAGAFIAGRHGPVAPLRPVGLALGAIPVAAALAALMARRSHHLRSALRGSWRALAAAPMGGRVTRAVETVWQRVRVARPTSTQWAEAMAVAFLNWLETCGCLAACIVAVGGHVPWRGLLVAYALSQVAASLPVTPGGIGVVEGSLTALLVAYGLHPEVALAAVLLYRAVSFWGLVPIGWAAWAALSATGRRPHPWAHHLHTVTLGGTAASQRKMPDRLLAPPPCVHCDDERPDNRPVPTGARQAPP